MSKGHVFANIKVTDQDKFKEFFWYGRAGHKKIWW